MFIKQHKQCFRFSSITLVLYALSSVTNGLTPPTYAGGHAVTLVANAALVASQCLKPFNLIRRL